MTTQAELDAGTNSWRHPLSRMPGLADAETARRYGVETANWSWMLRDISAPFQLKDATAIPELSLKDCHSFCGKASAMYATVNIDPTAHWLFNRLYKTWFPLTSSDTFTPTFFTKFIYSNYEKSPKDLAGVIKVHPALSQQVRQRMQKPVDPDSEERIHGNHARDHHLYNYLSTFSDILIVVDSPNWNDNHNPIRWQDDNALLVVLDPSRAEGLAGMEQGRSEEVDGLRILTLRAGFERIVRLVVAMQKKANVGVKSDYAPEAEARGYRLGAEVVVFLRQC